MADHIFTGSGVAIITPMNSDGTVNYKAFEQLLEFHVQNGTDAVIACGTTGEAATLSEAEHCKVLSFVAEKINGRIPVIAGTGSNDTSTAVMLSKEAEKSGVDALLSVTPYYNKTSQAGLVKHFNVIADSTDLPVILYNVPSRTGCNIQPKTCQELSKHPKIRAIKESSVRCAATLSTSTRATTTRPCPSCRWALWALSRCLQTSARAKCTTSASFALTTTLQALKSCISTISSL